MNAAKPKPETQQQRLEALLQEIKALQQEMISAPEPAEDQSLPPAEYTQGMAEGTVMRDGTIFVGLLYSQGNRPVFAAPDDAPIPLVRKDALTCAKALKVGDKQDFHVPDDAELGLLYEKHETGGLKGSFNTASNKGLLGFFTGSQAIYGSSTTVPTTGFLPDPVPDRWKWSLDFSNGKYDPVAKNEKILYRFVR